jgi:hypothetical protein
MLSASAAFEKFPVSTANINVLKYRVSIEKRHASQEHKNF